MTTNDATMSKGIKPYTANELMAIAIQLGGPGPISPERVLATYADRDNWTHVHAPDKDGNMRHYWAWAGPVIVGYELAGNAMKQIGGNDER